MVVEEPEAAWLEFYAIITSWLDHFYPLRSVTITSRDPGYMTPEIKYLLRRRNRPMRRQKTEEAAALSLRIEKEIARFNSRELCSLDTAGGTKKLWAAVRRIAGGEERKDELHINAEDLNSHYAAISMDPTYQQPTRRLTARPDVQLLEESVIFGILDHLRPTAAGLDLIPAWYLRVLAPACSGWLARLYSLSLCCSWVPTQWKNAVIYPVPKT